jgi:hypothetical protein
MPSVKRTGIKSKEVKTGFESYDGAEPHKRGMYRSKISQAIWVQFKTGAVGYKLLLTLEAEKGDPKDHAQFDGYPIWTNLVLGDKEAMIQRENNFYAALGAKDEPAIVFETGDIEQGVPIKTIGGKNPVGAIVNADIKMGTYNDEPRPEVDGIYKVRSAATAASSAVASGDEEEPEEDESDMLEGGDDEDGEQTREERAEELNGSSLPDLRKLATGDYDLDVKGLKKADIVDAIVAYEFDAEALSEEEEEEPDEEELDEEEEPEEEEEEEEDDERAERESELAATDRTGLKTIIRGLLPEFKVYKTTSDDDLRAAILGEEFGSDEETPF